MENELEAAPDALKPEKRPRKSRLQRLGRNLIEFAVLLVLGAIVLTAVGQWRAPDLAGRAPDFVLEDLQGKVWRLEELRGRKVVLNFWATWCGPCRLEVPTFNRFARKNPDVVVLGPSIEGQSAVLKPGAEELGIVYPVLRADPETQQAYKVRTLPTTIVIDEQGMIQSTYSGVLWPPMLWWLTR